MKFSFFATVALSLGLSHVKAFSAVRGPRSTPLADGKDFSGSVDILDLKLPDFFEPYERTAWEDLPKEDFDAAMNLLMKTKKPAGKAKEPWPEEILKIQETFVQEVAKFDPNDPDPVEGYLYFGNQEYTKILAKLCQVNPFWASAITVSEDQEHLELKAYSDQPKSDSDPKYLEIMRDMTDPSHRINIRFNMDWTLDQITTYESGEAVVVPEEEWDYYASGVCYNLVHYSSAVHALIHVFHYFMTTGMAHSTKHDKSLAAWADPYDDNISWKFAQVAALLLDSNIGPPEGKVIVGKSGFGGTPELMPILKKYLCTWGACKNVEDFNRNFLLKDLYATTENPKELMKDAGILTEYMKHSDNIEPYAKDLTRSMKWIFYPFFRSPKRKAFELAEANLTSFMSACGNGEDVFAIDSISTWVQLMSCTGIVHGSTLSYTRLLLNPDIIRWRNINAPDYDNLDVGLFYIGGGTPNGLFDDRHTFTGHIDANNPLASPWDRSPIPSNVQQILQSYDAMAERMKARYEKSIQKRDDFREFGWILTDHCTDGFDGKQHTISSYL